MKTRIISGVIAAALVVLVVFSGKEVFHIACVALAVIAVSELFDAFEIKGYKPLRFGGYISCFCLLLGAIGSWNKNIWTWLLNIIYFVDVRFMLYVVLLLMFCFLIFENGRYAVSDFSVTIMSAFYVCFLFWYLIQIRSLPSGHDIIWFLILGAVATDTFAYIVGSTIGKHKLIPSVSPKKTVEGAIGGIVGCVVAFCIYGLYFNQYAYPISWFKYISMGILSSIVCQIGDLAASCIKRYCGIKDFGKIIPGHGGILDRLDSVLVLSPLIYVFFS